MAPTAAARTSPNNPNQNSFGATQSSQSHATLLHPEFDEHLRNKINSKIKVRSSYTLTMFNGQSSADNYHPAIASAGFSSFIDGTYIFAVQIDSIAEGGALMVGFTENETFESEKCGFPGWNGIVGTALGCASGQVYPRRIDYLPPSSTKQAKEIVSILAISKYGTKKTVTFVVDGKEGRPIDCSTDFDGGRQIFPCIFLGSSSGQVHSLAYGDIQSSPRVLLLAAPISVFLTSLCEKCGADFPEAAALALVKNGITPNNFYSLTEDDLRGLSLSLGDTKTILTLIGKKDGTAALDPQLLQRLDEKDQIIRRKDLELQLQKQILQQKDAEILRLLQLLNPSPFVKDKLYQIDFAANGIASPEDANAFGTLITIPPTSLLANEAKNMFRKGGSHTPSLSPVAGFSLEQIDAIYCDVASIELRIRRLQHLRLQGAGNFFNPSAGAFTAEQLQTLIALRDQFLPRPSNADPKLPNLINVFHGTKVDHLQSVVNGLVAVRSLDAGYFGSGVYTTTSIEYAAKYAKGDFDFKNGPYPPRASDGCIPVVWCVAAVGVCYPLTREVDYSKKRVHDGMDVCDFFGMPLAKGYDCHCVAVNESVGFQAVPRKEMQYMEVVFDQEVQVLPIAVLWVKPI